MSTHDLKTAHDRAIVSYLMEEVLPQDRKSVFLLLDALVLRGMPLPNSLAWHAHEVLSPDMPKGYDILPVASGGGVRFVGYKTNAGLMVARALQRGEEF